MRIKKIGHCCLVVDTGSARILTDPGTFTTEQEDERDINIVLITHEHADHLHIESLARVLENNPDTVIVTNSSVAKILLTRGIECIVLESGGKEVHGAFLEAYDAPHEEIFEEFGLVQNTGYRIDHALYIPGDSFHDPETEITVLALPVAGPWCRVKDSVRFALAVQPKIVFPVHDGMIKPEMRPYAVPQTMLPEAGIEFIPLVDGATHEFT